MKTHLGPAATVLVAMLSLPVGVRAAGINLAWNECASSANSSANMSFACNADNQKFFLVGSFVPPDSITKLSGEEVELQFQSPTGTIPDWWQVTSAGCRFGSMTPSFTFFNLADCSDYWNGQAAGGSQLTTGYILPNNGRIQMVAAVQPSAAGPVSSSSEYYAVQVIINSAHTTGIGSSQCSGCNLPITIIFDSLVLTQPVGYGDHTLTTPVSRNFVTWQATQVGGFRVTPAQRTTFGQIKALYR